MPFWHLLIPHHIYRKEVRVHMNNKKFVSIKAKLLAIILPIVIIIVATLTILSYLVSKSVIAGYSENLLSSSIENQGNEIEAWLNENLSAFQAIKHSIEQTKPGDPQLQALLNQYYNYNSNYPDGLYLADGQGNLMTAAGSSKSDSLHFCKTFTAINRTIVARNKWYACYTAACRTCGFVHLTRCSAGVFTLITARFASQRLVLKAFLRIKFLLSCGKYELLSAFFAN